MSKLPKQVREAEERANKALEEMNKPEPLPDDPKPDDPPADPDPPNPDDAPPPEPPKDEPGKDRTDWKAKYHTLQGMFNSEVPRLNAELKAARKRIDELTAEAPKKPDVPDPLPTAKLPEALVAAIGEDAAEALFEHVKASITADLDSAKQQAGKAVETAEAVAQRQTQTAESQFLTALDARVPGWRETDKDPEWVAYLAERDPLARRTRQELIAEAYRDGDVDGVAAFFMAFKGDTGKKPADPPPTKQPDPREKLLVPDTSGRRSDPQDKKVWTKAEIAEFYKQVAIGKIPPDRAAKTEEDIVAAGREGRIR